MKKRIKTITITRSEVKDVISKIPFTAFFGTTFIKKDGSTGKMNCNRSIGQINRPITSTLLTVFDVNAEKKKGGFRRVNLDTIFELRTAKKRYLVI